MSRVVNFRKFVKKVSSESEEEFMAWVADSVTLLVDSVRELPEDYAMEFLSFLPFIYTYSSCLEEFDEHMAGHSLTDICYVVDQCRRVYKDVMSQIKERRDQETSDKVETKEEKNAKKLD